MPTTLKIGKSDSNGKVKNPRSLPGFLRPSLKGIIIALLLIGSLSAAGYYYYKYTTSLSTEAADSKKTITSVMKLMSLPEGEVPTVATVTDKKKLQNQQFFKKAENGDKVLIYQSIKKAILYRPSTNKIVDVAPINTTNATPSPQGQANQNAQTKVLGTKITPTLTPTPTEEPQQSSANVVLLNGTDTVGATSSVESELTSTGDTIRVVDKSNTKSTSYAQSRIFLLNPATKDIAEKIRGQLGIGKLEESLPDTEQTDTISKADIVVIVGADRK